MSGQEARSAATSLDFRTATGDEALMWFMEQATKMDDALEAASSDHEALIAVTEFLAIVSSLAGELLRRIGPGKLRPAEGDSLLAENERLRAKLAEYDKYVAEFTNNA